VGFHRLRPVSLGEEQRERSEQSDMDIQEAERRASEARQKAKETVFPDECERLLHEAQQWASVARALEWTQNHRR
jgi:predicted alpha/beta superfamily hydrolase